ncbi:hypothetical protein [Enterobacter sp. JMULE2]|nr:hypothetical protein [Enterobacter sp. JMULE2]
MSKVRPVVICARAVRRTVCGKSDTVAGDDLAEHQSGDKTVQIT